MKPGAVQWFVWRRCLRTSIFLTDSVTVRKGSMSSSKDLRIDEFTPRRLTGNRSRQFKRMLIAPLALVLTSSILISTQPAFGASNANFVGRWKISGGYLGFTVKSENRATGACAGVTASPLYHLKGCHVTGNKYVFTITEGASYRSRNVGTISGNAITGSFKDTNGTNTQYTGVR